MKTKPIAGLALLALLAASCSKDKTQQRVEKSPAGDTLETFEVLAADTNTRQGLTRLYYAGGKQLKAELRFEQGKLIEVLAEYEATGAKRGDGSTVRDGSGTLKLYDDAGNLTAAVSYAGGWPSGAAQLRAGGQSAGRMSFRGGLPVEFASEGGFIGLNAPFSGDSAAKGGKLSDSPNVEGVDKAWLEQLVKWIADGNYESLYQAGFSKLKAQQTMADQKKYFSFCQQIYGGLSSWKLQGYNLQSAAGMGEGLEAAFECKFRYTPAQLSILLIREGGQFRPAMYSITLPPYTPVLQVTRTADPVVNLLKTGEHQKLYEMTSARFKEQTSWANFESAMKQLKQQGAIESSQLLEHEVGMIEHAIALAVIYELKVGGKPVYFQMTFTQKPDGGFVLEGMNLQ